jgi:hypothetical protein
MLTQPVVRESSDVPKVPRLGARQLVLAIRVLLLLVAAGAAAVAVAVGRQPSQASAARYICPMHPDVVANAPGECPVCRMALEPVRSDASTMDPTRAEMGNDSNLRAVENVRRHDVVDVVRTRSLLFDLRELRGPASTDDDGHLSAIFYNDQIAALDADEAGTFSSTADPKATVAVRRIPGAASPWDASTSRIRFEVRDAGTAKSLPPGTVGWIELARKQRQVLTVPASAVLQSKEGPYVLVFTDGLHIKKRPIQIGETFSGLGVSVVLSGLRPADRVIARATFFLDAERRQDAEPAGGDR